MESLLPRTRVESRGGGRLRRGGGYDGFIESGG